MEGAGEGTFHRFMLAVGTWPKSVRHLLKPNSKTSIRSELAAGLIDPGLTVHIIFPICPPEQTSNRSAKTAVLT